MQLDAQQCQVAQGGKAWLIDLCETAVRSVSVDKLTVKLSVVVKLSRTNREVRLEGWDDPQLSAQYFLGA